MAHSRVKIRILYSALIHSRGCVDSVLRRLVGARASTTAI